MPFWVSNHHQTHYITGSDRVNEAKICNPKWVICQHLSVSVCILCSFDIWPSFLQVTTCIFPMCQCWQNNWLCMEYLHTERHKYDQTNFYCKFWLHSLDVNLFESFQSYLWPKMVFKMSQDIPTTALAITYNFFFSLFLFFPVVMTQAIIKLFGAVYIFCWYVLWFLSSVGM